MGSSSQREIASIASRGPAESTRSATAGPTMRESCAREAPSTAAGSPNVRSRSTVARCGIVLCASSAHASLRGSTGTERVLPTSGRPYVIADADGAGGIEHQRVGHAVEHAEDHQDAEVLVGNLHVRR